MNIEKVKVVVFVPKSHAEKIRQAVGDAGAGELGNYSHCTFSSKGKGRFTPLSGAHPTIGKIGKTEVVDEERIEFICKRANLKRVLAAMKKVHPYEEIAFDVYPLLNL